jgi:hypothetical protein
MLLNSEAPIVPTRLERKLALPDVEKTAVIVETKGIPELERIRHSAIARKVRHLTQLRWSWRWKGESRLGAA